MGCVVHVIIILPDQSLLTLRQITQLKGPSCCAHKFQSFNACAVQTSAPNEGTWQQHPSYCHITMHCCHEYGVATTDTRNTYNAENYESIHANCQKRLCQTVVAKCTLVDINKQRNHDTWISGGSVTSHANGQTMLCCYILKRNVSVADCT